MEPGDEALAAALRLAAAALGAGGAFVVSTGADGGRIRGAVPGDDGPARELAPTVPDALAGSDVLQVPLAATHSRFRDLSPVAAGTVGALLATHLPTGGGAPASALCIWAPEPRAWGPDDLRLLGDAAATVAAVWAPGPLQEAVSVYRSQEHLLHAQKMEAVGRLAGGMAHDFNNLLTAIMGFGELLLEGMGDGDPGRVDAEEIVRSAARGRDLTAQLLSFSRRGAVEPSVVELNGVVEGGRRLLERLLDAGVRLDTNLDPASGPVRIDPGELEQIVVNLAVNARDALPPGGGVVRIETRPVELVRLEDAEPEAIPAGRWETLAVVDDGVGMDAALRLRIFEPFFTTKAAGRGTGLGLATVYGIVKRAGGYVAVESRPGAGSTFRIYLPPAREAPSASVPDDTSSPRGTETVLLVEDQDQIRALLARQLERSGFRVLEAADGLAALEWWHRDPGAVDIVVSDVVMPGLDGPTLVERIRAERPDLPVVFISGYPGAADPSERDVPLPEARFLRKPFAAAELMAAIRTCLDGA